MISIIIPVYRVEAYLEKCIKSVLKQSYQDFEIILVDDGSPDKCGDICDYYALCDKRIKVIHKNNGGLSDARNVGLEVANGEYIAFLDSDDSVHCRMYEILLSNMIKTNSNLSVCGFQQLECDETPREVVENELRVFEGEALLWQIVANNADTIVTWNKLYKREIFEEIRFEVGRLHEDEFIVHHLLYKAFRAVYTDAKLYMYFKREGSIVNTRGVKNITDTWEAFEDRGKFLVEKSERTYFCTKSQQMAMAIENYFYFKNVNSVQEKQMCKFFRNEFKKILRDKKIYRKALKLNQRRWIVFFLFPSVYLNYIKYIEKKMW